MGVGTKAKAYGSLTIGISNDTADNPNLTSPALTDRLFQIGNGDLIGTRSNAMTVLRNGNIGIGNTAPPYKLSFADVLGDKISFWGAGDHYGIGIQNNLLQIHTAGALSDVAFGYGTSATFNETMRIKGIGRVGIGTSAPSQALDVTGVIHVSNLNGGATTLSTDASGNIIRTPSDARLKNNITSISNPLSKVMQMHGVTYDFIDAARFGANRQMGFLAQDLEKIVPEAVSSGGEYKSVNYPVLTALLTEAIKEQEKNMNTQQQRINDMEKEIAGLKMLVEKLLKQ